VTTPPPPPPCATEEARQAAHRRSQTSRTFCQEPTVLKGWDMAHRTQAQVQAQALGGSAQGAHSAPDLCTSAAYSVNYARNWERGVGREEAGESQGLLSAPFTVDAKATKVAQPGVPMGPDARASSDAPAGAADGGAATESFPSLTSWQHQCLPITNQVGKGTVAWSLGTTAHPLCPRFTNIFGTVRYLYF
jgi:hypothetical protein